MHLALGNYNKSKMYALVFRLNICSYDHECSIIIILIITDTVNISNL